MRSAVITVALLMLGVVVTKVLPPLSETRNIAGYLALHTLFETFSIVISMLVFTVGWNAYRRGLPGNILLLACAFLGVGILDFTHMLSEAGMLDFLTPGSEVKEIHFALYARSLAAIAFFVVSVTPWRPLTYAASRYILLAAVLILTGCLHWISLFHDDLMPATFIPGQGYTPFKIYYEYALVAFNMVTAFVLLMRMRRSLPFNAAALFGAVCTMALSEFFFTIYAAVNYDLLGHIYKAVSYFFLYRAIFVETIEHPYNLLHASQNKLQATLDAIPDLFFEIGLDGRFYDYHAHSTDFLAAVPEAFLGKTVFEVLPADAAKICMSALQEASEQGRSTGRVIALQLPQCERWFELSVAAKPKQVGQDRRFIFLARDITARKHAEDELRIAAVAFESQESLMITDAGGVILRVNPAFTRDTGYTAAEAVGHTPRLLKSGRHDAAFYAEMWETLLRTGTWQGEIWDRRKNGEVYLKWLTITAVKDSNGTATHYVGTHIDITERKAAEEEIKSMAFYDPLTGLPNRRLLMVRLKQALASSARNGHEGALLFIDLDNFKT
ncbi:MAG TPA: MASE3 domain-containing protein, partial [Gallionella sp.]